MSLIQSKNIFTRMMFSFTVGLVIIVLVLSYLLYSNFEKIAISLITDSNAKVLSQISYSASYMNDNARNFAFSVFGDSNTTKLMYQNTTDFKELVSQMEHIRDLAQKNSFVSSLYIYNRSADQFLSAEGTILTNKASFADQGLVKMLEQISIQGKNQKLKPIPRKIPIFLGGNEQTTQYANVYSYIVYDLFSQSKGVDGAVIVNIKSEYLQNIIESLTSDNSLTEGDIYIIDNDATVVSDSNNRMFLQNITNRSYVQKVLSEKDKSGYFIDNVNGKPVMVTFASSDSLGWKFISITPYSTITNQFNKIKETSIFVCMIILLMGVGISFFISRSLSSPLQLLAQRMAKLRSPSATINRKIDEVSLFSEVLDETYQKAIEFDKTAPDFRIMKKNSLLVDLLFNECDIGDIRPYIEKYEILLDPEKNYILIGFNIDRYTEFVERYPIEDRTLLRYAIANAAKEILGRINLNEVVNIPEDMIVIILHVDTDHFEELRRNIFNAVEDLQNWTTTFLRLSLSAAMGYVGKNLSEIHKSYQELLHISRYRFVYGYGSILSPDSLKDQESTHFKLPKNFEKNLHDALIKGNTEMARKEYEAVLFEVINYSYDTIMSTILYLTYSIYNMLNVIEGNSLNKFNVNLNEFTKYITNAETIDDVSWRFQELFLHIVDTIEIQKNNRKRVVTDTIVSLIETNYRDKGLCLEGIANTINMSKVYVGKLFRESFGQSVAEYITELRIKKAIELLGTGRQHLSDILDEIGIENKNYFYKQFKSKMGVSFSDYKLKKVNEVAETNEEN